MMAAGWLATVVLFPVSAWVPLPQAAAQGPKATTDVVRARQFVVVDENGTERIVISPVPDPQIMGKRMKRRRAGIPASNRRARDGAVTFIQRFSDALNLDPHFHTLVLDGI